MEKIKHTASFSAGNSAKAYGIAYEEECSPPLRAASSGTSQAPTITTNADLSPFTCGNGQVHQDVAIEEAGALNCMHDQQIVGVAAVDCRNGVIDTNVNGTLQAKPNGGWSVDYNNVVMSDYLVRRLTPIECQRLQGFPDGYGTPDAESELENFDVDFWTKVRETHARINEKTIKAWTEKAMRSWYEKLHTDAAEYKMWGNGIALPCALYVMEGIAEATEEETTIL